MQYYESIAPIENLPFSYEEIKTHCKIDSDDERDYLIDLAKEAIEDYEKQVGHLVAPRQVILTVTEPALSYRLRGPVWQLDSVTDLLGNSIADNPYKLIRFNVDYPFLQFEKTVSGFVATYEAGLDTLPLRTKLTILRMVMSNWENRGDTDSSYSTNVRRVIAGETRYRL